MKRRGSATIEVVPGTDQREWTVAVDGTPAIRFAGPHARERAESDRDQLATRIGSERPPVSDEGQRQA